MKIKKKLAIFLTIITVITSLSTTVFAMDGGGTGRPTRDSIDIVEEY